MKKLIYLFVALFFLLLLGQPSFASGKSENIRVLLENSTSKAELLINTGNYQIIDLNTGLPISLTTTGEKWSFKAAGFNLSISKNDTELTKVIGPIMFTPVDLENLNLIKYKNLIYQDAFIIANETSGISVINSLDMEKYLYGVVGKEIGKFVPDEALKAQAIVSRTYAYNKRGKNTKYDVTPDTISQVYGGYGDLLGTNGGKIKEAVDSTKNLVIYYENNIIDAVFHSNAGGYTEDSENVWSTKCPYLRAVPSPEDIYALKYTNQSAGWPANSYSWEKIISINDLYNYINDWNKVRSDKIDIGEIVDLKISKNRINSNEETKSSRVTELKLIGTKGSKSILKDNIRSFLGLKSTLFELSSDQNPSDRLTVISGNGNTKILNIDSKVKIIGADNNKVNCSEINILGKEQNKGVNNTSKIYIKGKGYGHGLGMSQWGAIGMAEAGKTYEDIIYHYYGSSNSGELTIEEYK